MLAEVTNSGGPHSSRMHAKLSKSARAGTITLAQSEEVAGVGCERSVVCVFTPSFPYYSFSLREGK